MKKVTTAMILFTIISASVNTKTINPTRELHRVTPPAKEQRERKAKHNKLTNVLMAWFHRASLFLR